MSLALRYNPALGGALRTDELDTDTSADRNSDRPVFLGEPVHVSIGGDEVRDLFDYGTRFPVRFIRVTDERLDSVHSEYGDVERFIDAIADDS